MRTLLAFTLGLLLSLSTFAFDTGDKIVVLTGPSKDRIGTVVRLYEISGEISVFVEFGENDYGFFKESDIEVLK